MQKSHFISFFLIILLLVTSKAFGEQDTYQLEKISNMFFTNIQNKNFNKVSQIFHFPPNYSNQELEKDRNSVIKGLKYFDYEFGTISSYKKAETAKFFLEANIGGGDIPYWKEHPQFAKMVYEVKFSKENEGFIVFYFCRISDKYEIRSVGYALPMSRADTKERVREIFNGFMELIKSE